MRQDSILRLHFPRQAVCQQICLRMNEKLYREMDGKYRWTYLRIRAQTLNYKKEVPIRTVQQQNVGKTDVQVDCHYDLHLDTAFRVEIIRAVTEKLMPEKSNRLTYQDMICLNQVRQEKDQKIEQLFSGLVEEIYLSYQKGGTRGIKGWLSQNIPGMFFSSASQEERPDSYRRRYETELYFLRKQTQETLEKLLKKERPDEAGLRLELNRIRQEVTEKNKKEIRQEVYRQIGYQLEGLPEKVYGRMERRLEDEKKRRGM